MAEANATVATANTAQPAEDLTTKEGDAVVFSPPTVFYNPVQEFNRDLTIAVVTQFAKERFEERSSSGKTPSDGSAEVLPSSTPSSIPVIDSQSATNAPFEEQMDSSVETTTVSLELEKGKSYEDGIRILEGLAATGLRSVRFAMEVPGIKKVVANDFSQAAVEYIKKNIEHNKVGHLVEPSYADAAMLMYQSRRVSDRFDVVDVDPYGSPAQFLDAAVQAVSEGGLLCVTCTDLATLCGNFPETCHSKYGAIPVKGKFCHEMALRIMLQSIEASANRYSRYIVPLLSVSADFYIRMFMKVYTGQIKVKESITKISMVYVCSGCGAYHMQPMGTKHKARGDENNFKYTAALGPPVTELCEHCSFKHHLGGPIWSSRIHDADFVKRVVAAVAQKPVLGTSHRIMGMLSVVSEELPEVPLYYVTDELCKMMHCTPPTQIQIRSAIMNACYPVSLSHAAQNSIKTTAPMGVIWDILRCWVNKLSAGQAAAANRIKEGSVAYALRFKEPSITANFTARPDASPASKKTKLMRFQVNPEPNWGPKAKAGPQGDISVEERRQKGMRKAKWKAKRKQRDLKQFPCKRLKVGKCNLGEACKYSHSLSTGSEGTDCADQGSDMATDEPGCRQQQDTPNNGGFAMDGDGGPGGGGGSGQMSQLPDNTGGSEPNLYTSF